MAPVDALMKIYFLENFVQCLEAEVNLPSWLEAAGDQKMTDSYESYFRRLGQVYPIVFVFFCWGELLCNTKPRVLLLFLVT